MIKLRDYQEEMVANVMEDLNEHESVGVIAPTGSGKTICMVEIADRFHEMTGKSVLILSHLSLLTTQTTGVFEDNKPHLRVGILQGQRRPPLNSHVIISTMQSSRNESKIERYKKDIGLIIVDECHYICTNSYESIMQDIPDAKVVGFTATPFRSGKIMTDYFDKISFTISLRELIKKKYLVEPVLHQIKYNSGEVAERMRMVIEIYKKKHPFEKAIVFMKTIEDAKMMRMALVDQGINAKAITSEITSSLNRDEILDVFQNGHTDILTTVNVLTAGVDLPCVNVLFMPYATTSPTMFMQRVGRSLRLFPGKTHADVYTFGNAPSISKELHKKMLDQVLDKGAKDKIRTVTEEVDHLELLGATKTEQYLWTIETAEVIKYMKSLGMSHFSEMIDTKDFPSRFLQDLKDIRKRIPQCKVAKHQEGKISEGQKELLTSYGFDGAKLDGCSRSEASHMIAAFNSKNDKYNEHVLASGRHKGKHLSLVPPYYMSLILRGTHTKKSGVADAIRDYLNARQKGEIEWLG